MNNEELVEELLWVAHRKGIGNEVIDKAKQIQTEMKFKWVDCVQKAYHDLDVDNYKID
jgi:hypothetical protein